MLTGSQPINSVAEPRRFGSASAKKPSFRYDNPVPVASIFHPRSLSFLEDTKALFAWLVLTVHVTCLTHL